jgi:hypothetical protein
MLQTSLRRFAGWLALASFIATQTVAVIDARHVALSDDTACMSAPGSTVGTHHENGPQVEDIRQAQHPLEHCPICHLQRTLSNARPGSFTSIVLPPLAAAAAPEAERALTPGVRPGFSPRGPPAFL